MCQVKLLNIVNAHDAGTLVNPALAEAQVHGGMSMGIGFGLSERMIFDPKSGRTLNNNLLDYKLSTFIPSAAESGICRKSGTDKRVRHKIAGRASGLLCCTGDP